MIRIFTYIFVIILILILLIQRFKNTNYKIPLKYHFIFWLSYFTFNVVRWGSYYQDYWYSFKSNLVTFTLSMILVYINIYFLFPKFILKKKYVSYLVNFTLILCVFYIIRTELIYYFINENVWPESSTPQKAYSFNHIVIVFLAGIYDVALVTTIKLTTDWVFEKKRTEQLQKAQSRSELNFLKAQIQPHFFFNTLNNLYALAVEKSDKTPEVILKLSEIMQYVLYEVKEPEISLLKEINYIHSYLELEKLRYGDAIKSQLSINGNIDNVNVPPLLFLPFIENCFKHGAKNNKNTKVTIRFDKEDNWMVFYVENNFSNIANVVAEHGIGIENVKRRLQLLYLDEFRLKTNIVENKYIVELTIPVIDD